MLVAGFLGCVIVNLRLGSTTAFSEATTVDFDCCLEDAADVVDARFHHNVKALSDTLQPGGYTPSHTCMCTHTEIRTAID